MENGGAFLEEPNQKGGLMDNVKTEPKEEPKKETLTKQELITIQNLLYAGNFGLSASQFDQSIKPLINKLAKMVDEIK